MAETATPRLQRRRGKDDGTGKAHIFAEGGATLADTWLFYDGAPAFMGDPRLDALMNLCLELGANLWSARRRVGKLEHLLAEKGILEPNEVDMVRLDDEAAATWVTRRNEFVERLLGTVTAVMADATVKSDKRDPASTSGGRR
jgi:hypothetical protein